jgi:hypothetical protein
MERTLVSSAVLRAVLSAVTSCSDTAEQAPVAQWSRKLVFFVDGRPSDRRSAAWIVALSRRLSQTGDDVIGIEKGRAEFREY